MASEAGNIAAVRPAYPAGNSQGPMMSIGISTMAGTPFWPGHLFGTDKLFFSFLNPGMYGFNCF
jgi:hypothetical protein